MSKTRAKRTAPKAKKTSCPRPGHVLILRTCDANLRAYGHFQWPSSGPVAAPDWRPTRECGFGLHGFLWGEGKGDLASWESTAKWLVVEVSSSTIVDLDGKVKFPSGVVVHCGSRESATTFLAEHGGAGRAIVGGTATAGPRGTATAGDGGTATAGDGGTATAGDGGTATAGENGEIRIRYYDPRRGRYRDRVGFVGEDGLEPATAYILDESSPPKFVRKPEQSGG